MAVLRIVCLGDVVLHHEAAPTSSTLIDMGRPSSVVVDPAAM